jgi:hypothetical protein
VSLQNLERPESVSDLIYLVRSVRSWCLRRLSLENDIAMFQKKTKNKMKTES